MSTFVMLTRLSPQEVHQPRSCETLERHLAQHVRGECKDVRWIANYAVLGPWDYIDVFEAETVGRRPCDVIVEQARRLGAGLVVLGTHGRRGLRRLVLGSDAEEVVRSLAIPVVLVRAREAGARKGTARKGSARKTARKASAR